MLSGPFDSTIGVEFECQGVYAIKHETSGRCYVGSSVSVRGRLNQHKVQLERGQHHSRYLQNAWNKYGAQAFTAVLLEKVEDRDTLAVREQAWIDALDSYRGGFNARPNAENFFGMEWSEEQNAARKLSNKKTWARPELREALAPAFES